MKIAYCLNLLYLPGGVERIVTAKANWLARLGYDVTLIVYDHKGDCAFTLEPSVKIVDLNLGKLPTPRFPWRGPEVTAYREKLTAELMREHYDIVISTGRWELYFLPSIPDGSKKVLELHETLHYNEIYRQNERWLARMNGKLITWMRIRSARKFDRVVMLNSRDYEEMRCHTRKAVRITNFCSVQPHAFSTCENKQVIAVGRVYDRVKGFDYLLDAWALVIKKHPDWQLAIYGETRDNDFNKAIEEKRQQLQLSADIFKGKSNDIMARYAESSIMVCSSRYECFPLVPIEAAACGLPVVSFDCLNGPRDIIEDGKTGILVPQVGDVQGLADAICRLIEDEPLRKQMGIAARETPKRFDPETIMQQWDQLFQQLLKEK